MSNQHLSNTIVYVNRKEECTYSTLERVGIFKLGTAQLLPGKDLKEKTAKWLSANWMSNMALTRTLVAIICEYNEHNKLSLPVSSESAKQAVLGVVDFIRDKYPELSHLIAVYFPNLTLGGRELPPISKAFNEMTYAERQEILRANNEAKVELVEN